MVATHTQSKQKTKTKNK